MSRTAFGSIATNLALRFEDPAVENAFQIDRKKSTQKFTAGAIGFSALLWASFSVWDASTSIQGVDQTRFRFMVAVPTLLTFFALTFTFVFRRFQDVFLWCFTIAASLLCVKQLHEYESGPSFLSSGSGAMNFVLIMVFTIGLFPVGVFWSVVLGTTIIAIYGVFVRWLTDIDPFILSTYLFNIVSIFVILIFVSYGANGPREQCSFGKAFLNARSKN